MRSGSPRPRPPLPHLPWILRLRLPSQAAHWAVTSWASPNPENHRSVPFGLCRTPQRRGYRAWPPVGRHPKLSMNSDLPMCGWLGLLTPHRGRSLLKLLIANRPAPWLTGHSSRERCRLPRCFRLDVIRLRRGVVAGTRNREDVSDAAALQFTRSAVAVYGERKAGGCTLDPALLFALLSQKLLEFCLGVKRAQRCIRLSVGFWPCRGLGGGKGDLPAFSACPLLSAFANPPAGFRTRRSGRLREGLTCTVQLPCIARWAGQVFPEPEGAADRGGPSGFSPGNWFLPRLLNAASSSHL